MSQIRLVNNSLFVDMILRANGNRLTVSNVLLDTGSEANLFHTDDLLPLRLTPPGSEEIVRIRGIGGVESVLQMQIDTIEVGELVQSPAQIQMGKVEYGFGINGILGLDFLVHTGAQINLRSLTLKKE